MKVKEAQSNEVDWTKNPQLVVSKNLVIVLANTDLKSTFGGIVLSRGISESWRVGQYYESFVKSAFKPFHGEITLKNRLR